MSAYATASQAYTQSSVLTAPPERLVVMLYDGAGRFLARAAAAIRAGEAGLAGEQLGRAGAILDELLGTLDHEAGGQVADRLESIYLFCQRTLVEAQLQRDPARVDRVAALLAELREAWAQIAANPPAAEAPAGAGAAATSTAAAPRTGAPGHPPIPSTVT